VLFVFGMGFCKVDSNQGVEAMCDKRSKSRPNHSPGDCGLALKAKRDKIHLPKKLASASFLNEAFPSGT